MKDYESQLEARRKRLEGHREAMRAAIQVALSTAEQDTIKTPFGTASLGEAGQKVIVIDESLIPSKFWKTKDPVLDKTALNAAVKALARARKSRASKSPTAAKPSRYRRAKAMNAVKEFKPNELQLIQRTVARDCDEDEFRLFIHLCKAVRLDPLRRQCYAFVYGKNSRDKSKRQLTLVTSIQGYRTIADRTGDYRPDEHEAEYHFLPWKADRDDAIAGLRDIKDLRERKVQRDLIDELYPVDPLNPHGIEKAVVRVWKFSHGEWHQVVGEAYWEEHVPLKEGWDERAQRKTGEFFIDPKKTGWVKMPRLMIAKIAESQALRKGWPDDYSSISVEEETHREESRLDVIEQIKLAEENDRLRKIGVGKHRTISMDFGGREPIDPVPVGELADRALAFIRANARDPQALPDWQVRNRHALNEFWAIEKSAALAIKKAVEAAIEKANSTPAEEAA